MLLPGLRFTELFPVQSAVWNELSGGASAAHDLCIAAPTGSGKTLAYALPVVNSLARWAPGRGLAPCCSQLVFCDRAKIPGQGRW